MVVNSIRYPIICLRFSNDEIFELNLKDFLNQIAPEESNPYRKILEPEVFQKAFVQNDKLVWDEVLELQMCGGDTMWMPAEFSEEELKIFVKGSPSRKNSTGHSV